MSRAATPTYVERLDSWKLTQQIDNIGNHEELVLRRSSFVFARLRLTFDVCSSFVSTHEPPCEQWLAAVGQVLCYCWSFPH
jgi:hypothetical protein